MKVLIAYDGSACADAALLDLKRAGLPSQLDSIVLTVADVFPPPPPDSENDASLAVFDMREAAKSILHEAGARADQAARRVKSSFVGWTVQSEASTDSPAWGIIKRAEEWPADLVLVGSHGMSVTDRLLIGSVSQRVMAHAPCSVRVARGRAVAGDDPLHLLIGFDGSNDAESAVRQVASRSWPPNTEVRIITAIDDRMITAVAAKVLKAPESRPFTESGDYRAWLMKQADVAAERLRGSGLNATFAVAEGSAKRVLLETAEQWRADCIFLGATGLRGIRRLLLGSVASTVTAHAHCTVEIVR